MRPGACTYSTKGSFGRPGGDPGVTTAWWWRGCGVVRACVFSVFRGTPWVFVSSGAMIAHFPPRDQEVLLRHGERLYGHGEDWSSLVRCSVKLASAEEAGGGGRGRMFCLYVVASLPARHSLFSQRLRAPQPHPERHLK